MGSSSKPRRFLAADFKENKREPWKGNQNKKEKKGQGKKKPPSITPKHTYFAKLKLAPYSLLHEQEPGREEHAQVPEHTESLEREQWDTMPPPWNGLRLGRSNRGPWHQGDHQVLLRRLAARDARGLSQDWHPLYKRSLGHRGGPRPSRHSSFKGELKELCSGVYWAVFCHLQSAIFFWRFHSGVYLRSAAAATATNAQHHYPAARGIGTCIQAFYPPPFRAELKGQPGIGAGVGVYVGGLDVVPLLAAIAGCHCWAAIAGDRGGGCTSWRIGCGDVAGCRCWVPLLGCNCWAPLLGAIAGDRKGWVYTLACGAVAGCHCWVPLLGAIAGDRGGGVGVQVGGLDVVTIAGAMAGCHCWCHCCVPLRETIARKNWPECYTVLRCPFLCIDNTQKLAGAIWGLCWYNYFL